MTNELYHHGIQGKHWGVRRFQNKNGTLTSAGKNRYKDDGPSHPDYKKAHSSKSTKSMSDAELRSRINRLNMETQYKKLSSSDINRGKKYLDKVIKAGTTVATITTTGLTIYNNVKKINDIVRPTQQSS